METNLILPAQPIKAEAERLGFYRCGLAPAEPVDEAYAARYRGGWHTITIIKESSV